MKKTTILSAGTIIMIVLNGILLFVLHTRPGSLENTMPHPEPKQAIIDKLQFTPKQITQYEELIKEHRQSINELDSEIRHNKVQLYSLLSKEVKKHKKDSLITVISECQKQIEYVHCKHFEDIKKLCSARQKIMFEELVPQLPKLFGPKPPMGPSGMHDEPKQQ